MTVNKDFKRLVRSRMTKTGESYTSARSHLTLEPSIKFVEAKTDFAKLAGMSDEKVKNATGCTWEKWVWAFDKVGAHEWDHRAIVEYAHEKYQTPDWWAQMVVVGYERIKGLRNIGQRRGGSYETTKSKTIATPLATLYRAFNDKRSRSRWLPGVNLVIRSATPGKYMHITWPDGTNVDVNFMAKGPGKSVVAVAHTRLKNKADADARKEFWGERLTALAGILEKTARKKSA